MTEELKERKREPLTASRMAALLSCPRKHYWAYEVGLRRIGDDAAALRFGKAWHAAMEARWKGADQATAFTAALDTGTGNALDELQAATLAGLLNGYFAHYPDAGGIAVHPEAQFDFPLDGSRTFSVAGKIDGLCVLADGRPALIEHKTTGDSLDSASDYWMRLRFNGQVLQYVDAARRFGWAIETVVYDVVKKPAIRQKQNETAGEFCARLANDAKERPEFYFARREVAVLDQDLAEFEAQRRALGFTILNYRMTEKRVKSAEQAWPRCVTMMDCRMCEYAEFCLMNVGPTPAFAVREKFEELAR